MKKLKKTRIKGWAVMEKNSKKIYAPDGRRIALLVNEKDAKVLYSYMGSPEDFIVRFVTIEY